MSAAAVPEFDPHDHSAVVDFLGDVTSTRVVVLGDHTLELLCGLLRRGCPAALALRSGDTVEAASADLVIVAQPPVGTTLSHLLDLAARLLVPNGRLVLRTQPPVLPPSLLPVLRAHGFCPHRVHNSRGEKLVVADRRSSSPLHH